MTIVANWEDWEASAQREKSVNWEISTIPWQVAYTMNISRSL